MKDPELLVRSKTLDSDRDWFLGSAIQRAGRGGPSTMIATS